MYFAYSTLYYFNKRSNLAASFAKDLSHLAGRVNNKCYCYLVCLQQRLTDRE